jgi:hypothetical protein
MGLRPKRSLSLPVVLGTAVAMGFVLAMID